MRLIFFGTPAIAAAHLKALVSCTGHSVAAVITQPDKPRGRGQEVLPSPVKKTAAELGLATVLAPATLKEPAFIRRLRDFHADLGIVTAYGRILPKAVLDAARLGFFNVHFSLLPQLRGASPVEHAILQGLTLTGCSTFWIVEECDAGDLILQKPLDIRPGETAPELRNRLGVLGIELMLETLALIESGKAPRIPQDHSKATYAGLIRKEDGRVDFQTESAWQIERKIRAFQEWPKVRAHIFGKELRLLCAQVLEEDSLRGVEWKLGPLPYFIVKGKGFVLKCAQGGLLITEIQTEGKPAMSAWAFLQGLRWNK